MERTWRSGDLTGVPKVVEVRTSDLEAMQRSQTAQGLPGQDRKAGQKTRLALGAYQKAHGLKLDCWPTAALISQMRLSSASGSN